MEHTGKSNLPPELHGKVREILIQAKKSAYVLANVEMVRAYWNIGKAIVDVEQKGEARAPYGARMIKELSHKLTQEFGRGYDETNLKQMRQFYLRFIGAGPLTNHLESSAPKSGAPRHLSRIQQSIRPELSWTHYRLLIRLEDERARKFYMNEAANQNWSTRHLERNIRSYYYERILSKGDVPQGPVKDEKADYLGAEDFIKDPYVFEFLQSGPTPRMREVDLETALLDKMQEFMLELGKGFAFVARQKRISTETKDFYVDLVFYNYHLKCFVLADLKIGGLTHQDIGQMDMYVRIYEEKVKPEGDNPTIGIILCSEKDETIVRYSVLKENRRLFASKYKLYLPTEAELKNEIERRTKRLQ